MRAPKILAVRVLFSLGVVVAVALAWSLIASTGSVGGARAEPHAALGALRRIDRPVIVTGQVVPAAADRAGGVGAVAIAVPRVGTYRIADSAKGRKLEAHVGETVRIAAMTRRDPHGTEILAVEDYSLRDR